jgi:hypothetical protein
VQPLIQDDSDCIKPTIAPGFPSRERVRSDLSQRDLMGHVGQTLAQNAHSHIYSVGLGLSAVDRMTPPLSPCARLHQVER